jgi:hypothetical protein
MFASGEKNRLISFAVIKIVASYDAGISIIPLASMATTPS